MAQILAATKCHDCGSTTRVVETDSCGRLCIDCLVRLIANNSIAVFWADDTPSMECANCCSTPMYCEDCAASECRNCGDEARFCGVSCAASYDGMDNDDVCCVYCGDNGAYYCSPRCAYRDTGETTCTDCDEQTCEAYCEGCWDERNEDQRSSGPGITIREMHPVASAAQPIAGVDEKSVSMDGITFEFEID